jgi:nucleotide-binding universal stress UspA family protein
MRHILAATDFSEPAAAALAEAVEWAEACGGRITLLHVIHADKIVEQLLGVEALERLARSLSEPTHHPYTSGQWVEPIRDAARQKLDEATAAFVGRKVKIDTATVEGRPSTEIVTYANKNAVDLIVMGTHGRGAVGRALLGSVADHVIRQATCPVMLVRQRR